MLQDRSSQNRKVMQSAVAVGVDNVPGISATLPNQEGVNVHRKQPCRLSVQLAVATLLSIECCVEND
jgi:hypothetical protein